MRSVVVVVLDIGPDHSPKLALTDRAHVIQAIASKAANPSFGKSVLPRRSKGCALLFEAEPIDSASKYCPVDSVVVTDQIATRQVEWTSFHNLLRGPLRGRIVGYVEVKNSATVKAQDEEHVESAKGRRGHDSEVNCKSLV